MRFKNFLLPACFFLTGALSAQTGPAEYDAKWKIVDSLFSKMGLTQSALEKVDLIYASAKKEKNDAQLIRALVYRMNLQSASAQDATKKNIESLEKEISSAQEPVRSILESILAGIYLDYFRQNRYKLYNLTKTTGFKKDDIATWDISDLHQRIGELFLSSIRNEGMLWQIRLDSFSPIIIKGNMSRLRPTLFDLLAHRALDYFKSDERDMNKPAYVFEIDDPVSFADLPVFASHAFHSADSVSLHFQALQLFQHLIRLHQHDAGPGPLLDLDIERLQFIYQYGVMDNKEELYRNALTAITDHFGAAGNGRAGADQGIAGLEQGIAEARYLQADLYAREAGRYDPLRDTSGRYAYVQAKAICEKVIAGKDSSEGNSNCRELLKTILRQELVLQTEKFNVPGQPFRTLLSWRNFSTAWFRIVKMDRTVKEGLGNNTWQDDYWERLLQLPVLSTFSQALPATGDYQLHRAEIKIGALPPGEYALIASPDNNFSLGASPLALQNFYVSSISVVNYDNDYFVLHRETGQPLPGASVQMWNRKYEYSNNTYVHTRAEAFQTDRQGHFFLKGPKIDEPNVNQIMEITTPGDHFFPDDAVNNFYVNYLRQQELDSAGGAAKYEKDQRKTFLFTDRLIYRPGQTVYFKGILVSRDFGTRQPKILPRFVTDVILYDVNDQKIDSFSMTTNEYGSYHGKFILPQGLLKGEFKLEDASTGERQTFSVEEYKRPGFSVDYETLKGSYRVGDSVRVNGTAKAYAGNPIGGAAVKYQVERVARFPYTWLYWRTGSPVVVSQEIAHGIAKTNMDGSFSVVFAALPDRTVSKDLDPVFEYQVSADITDIGGETRSGQVVVQVGYKALRLAIKLPDQPNLAADSFRELEARTSNLSGEPATAAVTMTLYKLKSPDRLLRSRYWEQPDQFVMGREEYRADFPHDVYSDEASVQTWERDPQLPVSVSLVADSLQPGFSSNRLQGPSLTPGWYRLEARASDKFGQEVKDVHYLQLYDGSTGQPAFPQYQWGSTPEATLEPGSRATVTMGSSASGLFVIRRVERDRSTTAATRGGFSFFTLDNGRTSTEFPVTEADRGGFAVSDIFVKDNRYYVSRQRIDVPWTSKELKITYSSFRDKTLPGSNEKWQLHISGNTGDKVAAEVLTGMYDASLDAFRMQQWNRPDLFHASAFTGSWYNINNFYSIQSQTKYRNDNDVVSRFYKVYDRLLAPTGSVQIRIRGLATMSPDNMQADFSKVSPAPGMAFGPPVSKDERVVIGYGTPHLKIPGQETPSDQPGQPGIPSGPAPVQARTNFAETAFFFPDLQTDSSGNTSFSFTMPEALTRWKMMTLAQTKDLAFGYSERSVVSSKQLMVQPNAPRFLREGDRMELSARVVNLTDSEMTGQMELQLTDPATNQSVDGWFSNREANQYFTVGARQSVAVAFAIEIPFQYNRPVSYRIVARARNYSDGEEATLPVVSNRMLVTENLPLNLAGNGTKTFHFDKLLQSAGSETLNHHALTVEFTSNPAWYAVQALPYLMEYPYECAEQTFDRFYANALASHIAGSSPGIRQVFEKWKTSDTAALLSNLEKNQELKSLLLQETPWVLQARSESQQKRNIALLFDSLRMIREIAASLVKLQNMQSPDGGFVWFKGGPDDRYITQLILTGIAHLQRMDAVPTPLADKINALVAAALPYLDDQLKQDFERLKKTNNKGLPPGQPGSPSGTGGGAKIANSGTGLSSLQAQYLYMRSSFSQGIPGDVFPAVNYYRKQAQLSWLQANRYTQGMIALALFRTGDIRTAGNIMASLKQNAIREEQMGMYWNDMQRGGYYWYQAPVETQSLLIEAFHEIAPNASIERDLKTWLLRQKQTQNWPTTLATADACYALLSGGPDLLTQERNTSIRLGDKTVSSSGAQGNAPDGGAGAQAGTGYFKKVFDGPFVNPAMGNITVTMSPSTSAASSGAPAGSTTSSSKPVTGARKTSPAQGDSGPAWGAVYWQYFENLDRIFPPDAGPAALRISKKLFIERNTDRGPVLEPVAGNGVLHVGDKLKIRVELRSDRDLEYVHMKDLRAACLEPVNVLSGYKWQGGIGYYESTGDIGTDFFFSWLPRGTYVFEYPVFVGQTGNFSNGVTSIECMYAPEFSFHSEGIRVNVETVNP